MESNEFEFKKQKYVSDEIDLVDLILIVWNRRLIIAFTTLFCVFLGVGLCFFLPKVYEISAILEPGRDSEGVLLMNPQVIRENILGGAYNVSISEQLKVGRNVIPDFKVTVPKHTDLVKISVESSDSVRGVEVLNTLLQKISYESISRLEVKVDNLRNQINAIKLKSQTLDEQITLLGKQSENVRKRIVELENGRRQAMTSSESNAIAALLYSNEVQNNQIYLNNLQMEKSSLEGEHRENDQKLSGTELKVLSIKGIGINKPPTVPESAIKPKKAIVMVLSLFFGLMGGIVLAFMLEFMNKIRQQQS